MGNRFENTRNTYITITNDEKFVFFFYNALIYPYSSL